ncbi:MAG: hypothetical protein DBX55_02100 [Verrucomicrobia bacterium]|nr:MAG: hypothetical protein DBX55_02100 [Verrucomicrobiota bacterium]
MRRALRIVEFNFAKQRRHLETPPVPPIFPKRCGGGRPGIEMRLQNAAYAYFSCGRALEIPLGYS